MCREVVDALAAAVKVCRTAADAAITAVPRYRTYPDGRSAAALPCGDEGHEDILAVALLVHEVHEVAGEFVKPVQEVAVQKGALGEHDAVAAGPVHVPPAAVGEAPLGGVPGVKPGAEPHEARLCGFPGVARAVEAAAVQQHVVVEAQDRLRRRRLQRAEAVAQPVRGVALELDARPRLRRQAPAARVRRGARLVAPDHRDLLDVGAAAVVLERAAQQVVAAEGVDAQGEGQGPRRAGVALHRLRRQAEVRLHVGHGAEQSERTRRQHRAENPQRRQVRPPRPRPPVLLEHP
mmetsp:Transcript_32817/g.103909  ORF Transcript_32817/g.103909 Transcript_32817/m.103909 type:complete len:292 (+) Transcript_32817:206-1081(+)